MLESLVFTSYEQKIEVQLSIMLHLKDRMIMSL